MNDKTRPRRALGLLTAITLLIGGCGTFSNLTDDGSMSIYGGVARDVDMAVDAYSAANAAAYIGGLFFIVADMPCSAIGDTLTLPYVVPVVLGWAGDRANHAPTPVLQPLEDPRLK